MTSRTCKVQIQTIPGNSGLFYLNNLGMGEATDVYRQWFPRSSIDIPPFRIRGGITQIIVGLLSV